MMGWRVMGLDKEGFKDVEMGDGVGWGCESITSVRRPVGRKVIRRLARWRGQEAETGKTPSITHSFGYDFNPRTGNTEYSEMYHYIQYYGHIPSTRDTITYTLS